MNKRNRIKKNGFTIIEVLIIIPIVLLTIGVFIAAIVSMTGEVLASRGSTSLAYGIQEALNKIEQDIVISNNFLPTTTGFNLESPQGQNNDDTEFNNVDSVYGKALILQTYATANNPNLPSPERIYIPDTPNPCSSAFVNDNDPLFLNVVYFVKNNALWRRVLAPIDYETVGCETPWQQASCNPEFVNSSYPFCKTNDIKLIEGTDDLEFEIDYYPGPNSSEKSLIANSLSANAESRLWALENSKTAVVSITATKTIAGKEITHNATIRATR